MKRTISNINKRNRAEKRFKLFGAFSIIAAMAFLLILISMVISKGKGAIFRSEIALEIDLKEYKQIDQIDFRKVIKKALKQRFPSAQSIAEINSLYQLMSNIAYLELRSSLESNPELVGHKCIFYLSASSKADMFFKGNVNSGVNDLQKFWLEDIKKGKEYRHVINWKFFQFADSRESEIAGIGAGLIGSIMTMSVFLALAFPIAIMCAFYLEEFAPKNFLTDIIEVSINNLAAIPSIIYGLLGLTFYLQLMSLPRSSSLVGGATLFMLVLPVIIIASRNTIRSIPNSVRDAAMALGASKMQLTLHHLLPYSIPGIMTGTILAVSRALGETAPLLMIGMVAFIADIPRKLTDPTTALPVQIYLWSDAPEAGFAEKTSLAIIILLFFLILLNLTAIIIRKKFERKW